MKVTFEYCMNRFEHEIPGERSDVVKTLKCIDRIDIGVAKLDLKDSKITLDSESNIVVEGCDLIAEWV